MACHYSTRKTRDKKWRAASGEVILHGFLCFSFHFRAVDASGLLERRHTSGDEALACVYRWHGRLLIGELDMERKDFPAASFLSANWHYTYT